MHVAMIGPELDARGGIASVSRALLGAPALAEHTIDYVPTMRDGSGPRKALGMARRQAAFVARLAQGWRPDLFHIHLSYFTSFYRKLAYFEQARATGAPVVVHVHAPDLHAFHQASNVHATAMRHVFTNADCVIALSEDMARTIHHLTGPGARVSQQHQDPDVVICELSDLLRGLLARQVPGGGLAHPRLSLRALEVCKVVLEASRRVVVPQIGPEVMEFLSRHEEIRMSLQETVEEAGTTARVAHEEEVGAAHRCGSFR